MEGDLNAPNTENSLKENWASEKKCKGFWFESSLCCITVNVCSAYLAKSTGGITAISVLRTAETGSGWRQSSSVLWGDLTDCEHKRSHSHKLWPRRQLKHRSFFRSCSLLIYQSSCQEDCVRNGVYLLIFSQKSPFMCSKCAEERWTYAKLH